MGMSMGMPLGRSTHVHLLGPLLRWEQVTLEDRLMWFCGERAPETARARDTSGAPDRLSVGGRRRALTLLMYFAIAMALAPTLLTTRLVDAQTSTVCCQP